MTYPPLTHTAPQLLNAARGHMEARAAQYDQPGGERSMGRAVAALNAVLGRQALSESEGWLLLQLLKDVRDRQRDTPHLDSLEDGIAYAALKAEARLSEPDGKQTGNNLHPGGPSPLPQAARLYRHEDQQSFQLGNGGPLVQRTPVGSVGRVQVSPGREDPGQG